MGMRIGFPVLMDVSHEPYTSYVPIGKIYIAYLIVTRHMILYNIPY